MSGNVTVSAYAVCVALSCGACGAPENWLEGTISEEFSLEFDDVNISVSGCLLRIDYVKSRPAATYIPTRLSVDGQHLALAAGATVSEQAFIDEVDVAYVSPTGRYFPETSSGTLRLDSYSRESGDEVRGTFDLAFVDGRDLHGGFAGDVLSADPETDCP
jgi:hypothetical protein